MVYKSYWLLSLNILRYGCNLVSLVLLIPWYRQLGKIGVLATGGVHEIAPSLANLMLYLFIGYPILVSFCLALSIWLGARGHSYSGLAISTLPLAYFWLMVFVAKKLVATITAVVKGKAAQKFIGAVPFEYMLPAPFFIPGSAAKEIVKKDLF